MVGRFVGASLGAFIAMGAVAIAIGLKTVYFPSSELEKERQIILSSSLIKDYLQSVKSVERKIYLHPEELRPGELRNLANVVETNNFAREKLGRVKEIEELQGRKNNYYLLGAGLFGLLSGGFCGRKIQDALES